MINLSNNNKTLVLGTALWGWGIEQSGALQLLDSFVNNGGRIIDTASNYPINNRSEDFGLAIRWIENWVKSNPNTDLSVIVKIGAIDNTGSPDANLSSNNIISTSGELSDRLGRALSCISVHWDNRGTEENDLDAIERTVDALTTLHRSGLEVGLSGVKFPDLYRKAKPEMADKWVIQVKENFITRKAREGYYQHFPNAKYLAYGVNLGGIKSTPAEKSSSAELRQIVHSKALIEKLTRFLDSNHTIVPRPTTLNDLALAFTYANPALCGLIIGPRNTEQLLNTLDYWNSLSITFDPANHTPLLTSLAEQANHE
ncbi:aldo/keto reductase [Pseudomonas putida]|uniref:aldo/keto reductase n=1 Tax=Pseudomonas putida TaxID=303 RepID=UPI002365CB92|nr:aldo/keto reductase [Pseudomonas putida]MDD2046487.1 aldo/keto reductase [Pseudomonas putida]